MSRDRTEQAREEAIQLYQQGVKAQALGEYTQAEDSYQRCLLIMRAIGNRNGQAAALHYLGTLYESKGDFQESLKCYEESNELFALDQDLQNSLFSVFFQAMLRLKMRQHDKSQQLLMRALELAFQLGPHFVQEAWSRVRQMAGVFFAQRQIGVLIRLGEGLEDTSRKVLDQGSSPYPMLERLAQMTQQLGIFLMGCGRLWEPPENIDEFPEEEVSSWLLQAAVNLDQATGSGLSFTDLAAKVIQEREH
ncbi:tetratricopeptide repeat protein [Myxococcota bacterium]|nr:tetratricopeptide repeat protein [Myxococcota bacterium]